MLKRGLLAVGGLVLVLYFLPSPQPAGPVREDRLALGTLVTGKLYGDEAVLRPHMERAYAEVERVASLMGHYREESALRRLQARASEVEVRASDALLAVLARAM